MNGRAEASEIVATSRFKPSKASSAARQRQQDKHVVDDWDAESSDDGGDIDNTGQAAAKEAKQADVFRASKDQWTEANSQAPTAVPMLASDHSRSLPGAAYGHQLQVNSNASARTPHITAVPGNAGTTIAAAPPRILQRPKEAAPGLRSDGSSANASKTGSHEHKTVEQRQQEYRLARERIFGTSSNSKPSGKGGSATR